MKWLAYIAFTLLIPNLTQAQFTDEFKGRATKFTYSENGQCIVEDYVTKIGLFDRTADAKPLTGSLANPGAPVESIPTAGLAAEHYWMSFELNMKAQREYRACVAQIELIQEMQGACPLTAPCSPFRNSIFQLSEYWVPFNVIDNVFEFPPGRLSYIEHFKAGIFTLNRMISHRDACRATLFQMKGTIGL